VERGGGLTVGKDGGLREGLMFKKGGVNVEERGLCKG